MPDAAQINRSISTIKTELEYLSQAGVLSPPQVQSIAAQLPYANGQPSPYVDPRYNSGAGQFNPSLIAQQAQNPQNAAHPDNPKHHEWAKGLAAKFGNAVVLGAGATFGGDVVNDVMKQF